MEYALAVGIALGVLLLFGGAYALMNGPVSIDERLARYAGGKAAADAEERSRKKESPARRLRSRNCARN